MPRSFTRAFWAIWTKVIWSMWRRHYEVVAVHWQAVVKSILSRVWETGDIYKAKYEGDRPP